MAKMLVLIKRPPHLANLASLTLVLSVLLGGVACKSRDKAQPSSELFEKSEDAAATRTLRVALQTKQLTTDCPVGKVCVNLLQINDVYEIGSVRGGSAGGLDRVAGLRQLLSENPKAGPTLTMLAGDFFNPSGLASIKEDGKSWAGRQMISVLKAIHLDYAVFGNHEFDLAWPDFKARLDESVSPGDPMALSCSVAGGKLEIAMAKPPELSLSDDSDQKLWDESERYRDTVAPKVMPASLVETSIHTPINTGASLLETRSQCIPDVYEAGQAGAPCFEYISSNVFASTGAISNQATGATGDNPFVAGRLPIPQARVLIFKRDEMIFKLGIIGLTINRNQKDYQKFTDVQASAKQLVPALLSQKSQADRVVALTHLDLKDDLALLAAIPDIALIMGGHDHQNSFDCLEDNGLKRCVAKADANALTVYAHRLIWDPAATSGANQLEIQSHLLPIDQSVPPDPKVSRLISCWFDRANQVLKSSKGNDGIALTTPIAQILSAPLDGRSESVRNPKGSNLTRFYTQAMLATGNAKAPQSAPFSFALLNGGSIRIDDFVGPGMINYYEAVRVLPFGGKLVTTEIKISDLARILRRSWRDLPIGSGAVLHVFPKIPSSDRLATDITEAKIAEELRIAAKAASVETRIKMLATAYLVTVGEDLSPEDKATITITDEPLQQPDLLQLLVESLAESYPLNTR